MDEVNRRLTFKLLTDKPPIRDPETDGRQFFIVTPKLLSEIECVGQKKVCVVVSLREHILTLMMLCNVLRLPQICGSPSATNETMSRRWSL